MPRPLRDPGPGRLPALLLRVLAERGPVRFELLCEILRLEHDYRFYRPYVGGALALLQQQGRIIQQADERWRIRKDES